MPGKRPRPGSGRFQWNTAGWVGGQLGGTLWLLLLGAIILPLDPLAGALVLLCFAVPNGLGLWIWRNRERFRPYPALQSLVAVMGLCALAALLVLNHRLGPGVRLPYGSGYTGVSYWFLLVFPALMAQFHFMERREGPSGSESKNGDPGE